MVLRRRTMRCPHCRQENDETNSFCISCGLALRPEPQEDEGLRKETKVEASSEEVSLAELQGQVRALQRAVQDMRSALLGYFRLGGEPEEEEVVRVLELMRPSAPHELARASTAAGAPHPTGDIGIRHYPREGAPSLGGGTSRGAKPPAPAWWGREMDWELLLGGNWLARIGVLAVVIGMAFFLKLAIDNEWIGETGQVVLGILGGVAFLGASEYWQKRYPAYAQTLAGGGIALLYLSIFAAFAIYDLIDFYPAVALLVVISVSSAGFAIRYESPALAIIGIVGAFAAPFITGGFASSDSQVVSAGPSIQLMAYVMVVDVGVLILSTFRNWRWFTLLALIGSLIAFGSWYAEYGDEATLLTAQGSLTIIFLIFVAATTLFHIVWRRAPQAFDQSLMAINAAAYFGISYGLLWDDFRLWMGGFTLVLSLFYGGLAYAVLVRSREHVYLSIMALGIALVLLTVAVPVQLDGPWVSVAWAAEGAVLIWVSLTLRMWQPRVFGIGLFAALVVRLLVFDTPVDLDEFRVFLNYRMMAFGSGVLAMYAAAYLVRREWATLQEWERTVFFPALLVGANFLTLWVFSAEVIAAVDSGIVDVTGRTADHVKSLSLSLLWAVYGSVVLVPGIIKGWRWVRLGGLAVIGVTVIKLFVFDSFALEQGYRVTAFLGLGAIMLVGGFLYQRHGASIKDFLFEEQKSAPQL